MKNLKLFVLGAPRLERNSDVLHIERRRALALLIYLALTREQHRRDALAALFWPEYDHIRARAALRRTLAALNQAIAEDLLVADRESIGVARRQGEPVLWLDVDQFRAFLASCQTHGHAQAETCPACLTPLAEAVALYRGDFLAGFTLRDAPDFDDWQLFQAESLRRELATALERLVHGYSAQHEFEIAIDYARRWLALDPFHEPAHRQLMVVYAWAGQRQAALRQYAECTALLERELGVPPQQATIQLYEAIKSSRFTPSQTSIRALTAPREAPPDRPPSLHSQPAKPESQEQSLSLLARIVRGQLVGREREAAQLGMLWSSAAAGEGQVLLVSGEAGVGKTRLVREIAAVAEDAGATVLIGRCEAEGGPPYAPIAQIIHAALANADTADRQVPDFILADLLTFAPQLRPRYPQIVPNPPLDPVFERERLFDSFVSWCDLLAGSAPLLLWVEDVHWADGATLALLRHLTRHARRMRLLVVMTFRDTEVELVQARGLKETLIELNRERLAESLTLTRLSHEQTRELLVALLATGGAITSEFLDSVYRETEGNPFFVEEVCKALIEEGKLYYAGGAWRRSDIDMIVIPPSIRATILSRVERLPPGVQELLQMAAVLGREFDTAILQALSGRDEEMLSDELAQAERAQLLSEVQRVGQLRYAFAHALIPFTLRESLSGLRRQHLHRRAAAAIETWHPNDVEALAYHFTAAGEQGKAIEYARRAARRAETLYAYDLAIQQLRTALDLAEAAASPETRLALLEHLADIHLLRGERVEAITQYQEALDLWHALPGAEKMIKVRLCRKIGESVCGTERINEVQAFEAAGRAMLQEGVHLMAGEPPHPETVRLLIGLSQDSWRTRVPQDWDTAEHYARAAVAMAEQASAPVELSRALDALAVIYAARGLFRERLHIALRRLAISREGGFGDMRERVHLLNEVAAAHIDVGEYTQAIPYLHEAERLASQTHAIDDLVQSLGHQATCAFRLDRWDDVALDGKWHVLRQHHPRERLAPTCRHLALKACVHALRGELGHASALREESLAIMIGDVPPEQWGRPIHY